jgi:hypothetical protein
MSARQYILARVLFANHRDDTAHAMFGSPLLNAIKLGDLRMLSHVINHFERLHLNGLRDRLRNNTCLTDLKSAFLIKTAVRTAIARDDVGMVNALLQAYITGYG